MNLEEIRRTNSTVRALEAFHLCRLLHVLSFFGEVWPWNVRPFPRIVIFISDVVLTFIS
jgi:hypothetical protein